MSDEEHRRAQLVQIWEDLDQEGKNRFSATLGFKGKPESRRRSARRLVQGSRSISPEKQSIIGRSYSSRYGRDKVVDLMDREKVDVTEYFKDVVYDKTRVWNGKSPPLAFQVPYRIRAIVMAVQKDSTSANFEGLWTANEITLWTRGVGRTFSQLASMLQSEINRLFDGKIITVDGVERFYETFGVALSDSGKQPLIDKANASDRVTNEVASVFTSLNVVIYSTPNAVGVKGAYDKVYYDD